MISQPTTLETPAVHVRQVAYRVTAHPNPFWSTPAYQPAGRWHRPGDPPTQYLSLSGRAAWAEVIRHHGLRAVEDFEALSVDLWAIRVDAGDIADYATFAKADSAGFPPKALIADNHARCQTEGRRLRELGAAGVLSPSAALPEHANLTLFGPRYPVPFDARTIPPNALPAQLIAQSASPPHDVLPAVRHAGAPHPDYEAYSKRPKP